MIRWVAHPLAWGASEEKIDDIEDYSNGHCVAIYIRNDTK